MASFILELLLGFVSATWYACSILSDDRERALVKDSGFEFLCFASSVFACFHYPYLSLAIQALFKIAPFAIECYLGLVDRDK